MLSKPIDLFVVYLFIRRLTTPFNQTPAFHLGLIDAEGNRLKTAETPEEKNAMTYFDRLVFNLKRLLAKIPGGNSRIATFTAALLLLREEDENLLNERILTEQFIETFSNIGYEYEKYKLFFEEMTTGSAVAGTGDDQIHWSKKRKKMLRR